MSRFLKVVESFVCEKCGCSVEGDGYTNHCPSCLWSLHIDVFPGDRSHECRGLMEPVDVVFEAGEAVALVHRCVRCGYEHKNRLSELDDREALISFISRRAEERAKKG